MLRFVHGQQDEQDEQGKSDKQFLHFIIIFFVLIATWFFLKHCDIKCTKKWMYKLVCMQQFLIFK